MTQEKSPMESRNLCGKNVAKFRNLLAGSPSQEKLAAKMQLEGLNINKNAIQRIECGKRMVKETLSWMFSQRSFTSALMN